MVGSAIKEFGKIDILVNNANINFPIKPFTALAWDEIEAKIMSEMKALYNCSQAVLKDMTNRKSGKLIFIDYPVRLVLVLPRMLLPSRLWTVLQR